MLIAELCVSVDHRRQGDREFGSIALACRDGDPVGDVEARSSERSTRVGEEGGARAGVGQRGREGGEETVGIHGDLRPLDVTAGDASGHGHTPATATGGEELGYSPGMAPKDPAEDELDAEELDLVAGGAQPSEQEPFSPGTYTIS